MQIINRNKSTINRYVISKSNVFDCQYAQSRIVRVVFVRFLQINNGIITYWKCHTEKVACHVPWLESLNQSRFCFFFSLRLPTTFLITAAGGARENLNTDADKRTNSKIYFHGGFSIKTFRASKCMRIITYSTRWLPNIHNLQYISLWMPRNDTRQK